MSKVSKLLKYIYLLDPEEKKQFREYIPGKVYKTERNISVLVAMTQLCMIILFLSNDHLSFDNPRTAGYFGLYIFLFVSTCLALLLYRYTYKHKKHKAFTWLRRIYPAFLCFWVLGITFLEQMKGNGLGVYCYLLPTTAALLLLTPLETLVIFGGTGIGLGYILVTVTKGSELLFGSMINGIFVTVLTVFISCRYYRSMATEFRDRHIIAVQYDEIQKTNHLLQQTVHMDQLTGLYNRHYLLEKIYPVFADCCNKNCTGMFLMVDIDFFKQYNDRYGHLQGDECLRQIAAILWQLCLEEDASPIRYGGEEFLIIKMDEQNFDAEALAEKLLQRIRAENIARDDVAQKRVTVSEGLWHDQLNHVSHIEGAIKCADDALYQAKSQGRNCLVHSQSQNGQQKGDLQ